LLCDRPGAAAEIRAEDVSRQVQSGARGVLGVRVGGAPDVARAFELGDALAGRAGGRGSALLHRVDAIDLIGI
jgi:hypothetical protein